MNISFSRPIFSLELFFELLISIGLLNKEPLNEDLIDETGMMKVMIMDLMVITTCSTFLL
jgi:hypothetical protein